MTCACSFLGVRGRELDTKWDDNGAGACFFLEQEMSDAMTGAPGWPVLCLNLAELVLQLRRKDPRAARTLPMHPLYQQGSCTLCSLLFWSKTLARPPTL